MIITKEKVIEFGAWLTGHDEETVAELLDDYNHYKERKPVENFVRQGACDKCDAFGGEKTYENQVCMPLNGKVVCIDWCVHQIVAALNAGGIETIACCCGHNKMQGRIDLADGRVLHISKPSA